MPLCASASDHVVTSKRLRRACDYDRFGNLIVGKHNIAQFRQQFIVRGNADVVGLGANALSDNHLLADITDNYWRYLGKQLDRLTDHLVDKSFPVPERAVDNHQQAAQGGDHMIANDRERVVLRPRSRDRCLLPGSRELCPWQLAAGYAGNGFTQTSKVRQALDRMICSEPIKAIARRHYRHASCQGLPDLDLYSSRELERCYDNIDMLVKHGDVIDKSDFS